MPLAPSELDQTAGRQVTWNRPGLGVVVEDASAQTQVQGGLPQWLAGWWAGAPGCRGLPGKACREDAEKLSGPEAPSPLASLPHVLVSRLRTHLVEFSKDGTELGMQDCQLEG